MDPLSFSASLIAVTGAATALIKGLNKLQRELRDASGTLASLANETTDVRLVLDAAETALQEWRTASCHSSLPASFNKVDGVLIGLTDNLTALLAIVERCLAERDPESGHFVSHRARIKWLSEKKRAKPLQRALQESKKNLLVLLEAHNLYAIWTNSDHITLTIAQGWSHEAPTGNSTYIPWK
jgi:hypothetical protein